MDLRFPAELDDFRSEVSGFLETNLPAGWQGIGAPSKEERETVGPAWRRTLLDNGYLAVAWPKEYGGAGLGVLQQTIVQEEFMRGVPLRPMPSDSFGFSLIGPTILRAGTDQQREYFLPKIVSGEHRCCQGYSEPESGSDLFGLRTSAVLDGDNWVINGQKVWQTAGNFANWIFALVRTDPDLPKANGISMLLIPMDQPGVEVRPIRTMTGRAEAVDGRLGTARHLRRRSASCVRPRSGAAGVAQLSSVLATGLHDVTGRHHLRSVPARSSATHWANVFSGFPASRDADGKANDDKDEGAGVKFELNDEQQALASVVARLLEVRAPLRSVRGVIAADDAFDRNLWHEMASDLELFGLSVPEEEYGGAGYSFVEQAVVTEEIGKVLLPGPYFSSAFTWEHDAHFIVRRALGSRQLLGPPDLHRDRIAAHLLASVPEEVSQ